MVNYGESKVAERCMGFLAVSLLACNNACKSLLASAGVLKRWSTVVFSDASSTVPLAFVFSNICKSKAVLVHGATAFFGCFCVQTRTDSRGETRAVWGLLHEPQGFGRIRQELSRTNISAT